MQLAYPKENPSLSQSTILIAGLVRNCETSLRESISLLFSAFHQAKSLSFLIVESDSTDDTCQVLSNLSDYYDSFSYVTLGNLASRFPIRTQRIAYCRNYYLHLIKNSEKYKNVDYVVVADLDGVNVILSPQSVATCWTNSEWDVCTANQNGPYYDIWALRHQLWSPNDCWSQHRYLQTLGVNYYESLYISIYSKMIRIPINHSWIQVLSSFGGLAIYRTSVLLDVVYDGLTPSGDEICEHVSLHSQISSNGGNIFINPALINASYVEHAWPATFIGSIKLFLLSQLQKIRLATRSTIFNIH